MLIIMVLNTLFCYFYFGHNIGIGCSIFLGIGIGKSVAAEVKELVLEMAGFDQQWHRLPTIEQML